MEAGTDLIVLTSHHIDLKNPPIGWRTLSYKMSTLSRCPALFVK